MENTTQKYNMLIQHGTYSTQNLKQKYNTHKTHHKVRIKYEHVNKTRVYNTERKTQKI